jgi:hypothetical protein
VAQFYAEIQGNRGQASRMGSKESGMYAHIRGWNVGVRVQLYHENGTDYVEVYETGGSTGRKAERKIASFADTTDGPRKNVAYRER